MHTGPSYSIKSLKGTLILSFLITKINVFNQYRQPFTPDRKKSVLFPEIGWVKKSLIHRHSRMCIRIYISYIFTLKQQTNKKKQKEKNKNTNKAKETKEEKKISLENGYKKVNLRPPG